MSSASRLGSLLPHHQRYRSVDEAEPPSQSLSSGIRRRIYSSLRIKSRRNRSPLTPDASRSNSVKMNNAKRRNKSTLRRMGHSTNCEDTRPPLTATLTLPEANHPPKSISFHDILASTALLRQTIGRSLSPRKRTLACSISTPGIHMISAHMLPEAQRAMGLFPTMTSMARRSQSEEELLLMRLSARSAQQAGTMKKSLSNYLVCREFFLTLLLTYWEG
jgi:hypothetical protein